MFLENIIYTAFMNNLGLVNRKYDLEQFKLSTSFVINIVGGGGGGDFVITCEEQISVT